MSVRCFSLGLAVLIAAAPRSSSAANPAPKATAAPKGLEAGPIVLAEREKLALLVNTPRKNVARTSITDLTDMADDILRESTDLDAEPFEAGSFAGCKGNWACIVLAVRQDYDPAVVTSIEDHFRRQAERRDRPPRFMVYLNNKAQEGKADRFQAFLIDMEQALRLIHRANRSVPDWKDEVSGEIDEDRNALRVQTSVTPLETPEEARRFLTRIFKEDFKPTLEGADHWEPYGGIEISGAPEGAAISLDGVEIGAARKGVTQIQLVRPGERQLKIRHPEYAEWKGPIEVKKGPPSKVTVEMERLAGALASNLRTTLFWTGLGVAAIGVGVTTYAGILSTKDNEERVFCFTTAGMEDACGGSQFIASGFSGQSDDIRADPNPGVPLAPLGLSLALTGGLWSVGAAVFSDDPELPWKETLVGLGLGTVSFVAMVLANPQNGIQKQRSMMPGPSAP